MSASNPPVNAVAYRVFVALQDFATPGAYKANPTLAAGDVKVSKDGGAFANLTTLPAVTPAAGIAVQVDLSAAEMTGDNIFVQFIDQTSPKEWADYAVCVQTVAAAWLAPTTAGRTLDVSAGGEAGVDWANIGSPTTAQNLSGTNIDTDQVVASVTGAVGSVTGAVGSVTGSVGSVTADVGITQAGADKVWLSAARTLTSFGTLVADVATAVWAAGTRALTTFGTLTADAADKLLGRNLAGGSDGGRTVQDALRPMRNKRAIAAGTLTVYAEDDATPAWTATVATAASDPINSVDPS